MKRKLLSILVCITTLSLCLMGCTGNTTKKNKNGKLKVIASFYTMYDFAKKIGKDKIEVTNMVPAGTEPHDWEPSSWRNPMSSYIMEPEWNSGWMMYWKVLTLKN